MARKKQTYGEIVERAFRRANDAPSDYRAELIRMAEELEAKVMRHGLKDMPVKAGLLESLED